MKKYYSSYKQQNSPPWQQNIFSSIIAAIGKQLKQSVNVFHSFMLYRRLPDQTNNLVLNTLH